MIICHHNVECTAAFTSLTATVGFDRTESHFFANQIGSDTRSTVPSVSVVSATLSKLDVIIRELNLRNHSSLTRIARMYSLIVGR